LTAYFGYILESIFAGRREERLEFPSCGILWMIGDVKEVGTIREDSNIVSERLSLGDGGAN
jgi:hypothetical protein